MHIELDRGHICRARDLWAPFLVGLDKHCLSPFVAGIVTEFTIKLWQIAQSYSRFTFSIGKCTV